MFNTWPIWEVNVLTYEINYLLISFIIITLYTLGCCKQIYNSTTIVTTTIYFTNVVLVNGLKLTLHASVKSHNQIYLHFV
jgi:hypothetical protein